MKKVFLSICLLAAALSKSQAYSVVTVQDSISTNTHWTCDKQYLLKGYVYITAGATLTIDSGVIIKGDKPTKGALIVERGAKLNAMGTVHHPIVFTSNQPAGSRSYGDWGGVILCGKSIVNWSAGQAQVEGGPRSFYGGTDPNDNSGEMHFVRIEFGGIAFSPNNEVNGLTFCGVGNGTQIDHIQVSYSGDDSYEYFGGTVNAKYLVAANGWDDDFDTDNGYSGMNQFIVGLRDPYAADQSGSKALESDSYLGGTISGTSDTLHATKCIFSNATLMGPIVNPSSTAYDAQYVAGAHIRRGSSISIVNSILAGWPCGVLIDESSSAYGSTIANISYGGMQFRNNIIAGTSTNSTPNPKDVVFVANGARSLTPTTANADTTSSGTDWSSLAGVVGPKTFIATPSFGNKTYGTVSAIQLNNPFSATNPNLCPNSTSPIVYATKNFVSWGSAVDTYDPNLPISYDTTSPATYNVPGVPPNFSTTKAVDAFFTRTNYVGAFGRTSAGNDNWMSGWCEFDPLNEPYDTICYTAPIDSSWLGVHSTPMATSQIVKVFPNPAQESATVTVDVNHSGMVKVDLLDLSGKVVTNIFHGAAAPGTQSYNFNTADIANGMYIISVMSDGKHKIIRFAVAK